MPEADGQKGGFTDVDRTPDPAMLVAGMDATAQWPAVRTLRQWERGRLAVAAGETVLDVGCGAGEVIIDLAQVTGPTGRAAGVDFSEQMLTVARQRAVGAQVDVAFFQGDATALGFRDHTFDAVRSERTLQWVQRPEQAVAEILRVTRPGGRICIIDSDWRSLIVEPSGPDVDAFLGGLAALRGESMKVGGRLMNILRERECRDLDVAAATHMWLTWEAGTQPAPSGFPPLRMVAGDIVDRGLVDAQAAERAVDALEDAARSGGFFMALTMFAVAAVTP